MLFFSPFCTKDKQQIFLIHSKLFYSLIDNKFLYGYGSRPNILFLLQNLSEMKNFLIKYFSSDLFEVTNPTWDLKLDWSLIETAECLVEKIELDLVANDYVDILRP